MRNKIFSSLFIFGFLFLLNVPLIVFAQNPGDANYSIVKCKGQEICDWYDFIELINRVISFLLYMVTVLAIFAFIYAGFLMMTANGNAGKISEAKGIFYKVVVGLIFAYGAWVLVYFILDVFKVDSDFTLIKAIK